MQPKFISALRGYVKIEIRGRELETFVNRAANQRYKLEDIRYREKGVLQCTVPVDVFFRLRPLLRDTDCRMHVLERHGFPFFLDKLGRRKFFAAGLILFVIGLYMLSSIVWQVKVEGTDKIPAAHVLEAARESGIYPMQWKYRLKDTDLIARQIQGKLPGTAWVGVELHGTRIVVKVVETTQPDKKPLENPRHLVAAKNALVTEIVAQRGKPVVQPNTYVRKGDILISGILGNETNQQTVVATGKVKGIVWYESKIEVPLTKSYKVYTGESYKRSYLVFGSRGLQITGYGKPDYEQSEIHAERKMLKWRRFGLPIGWMTEKVMQVEISNRPIELQEAIQTGIDQAKSDLLLSGGKEARITEQHVLRQKTENGVVYMDVQFGMEEPIAVEQAIIPGAEPAPSAPPSGSH